MPGRDRQFLLGLLSAGPCKIGASVRRFTPKKLFGGMWTKRALSASLLGGTLASRNYAYNLMPSGSRQLRTDPWFSSGQFSSLGTQNRPETVPRLQHARHSGVPGCVQILLTMELKDNSKCRVPGCIRPEKNKKKREKTRKAKKNTEKQETPRKTKKPKKNEENQERFINLSILTMSGPRARHDRPWSA